MTKQVPVGKEHFALVDDEDYKLVSQYKWYHTTSKDRYSVYAQTTDGVRMHNLIMGLKNLYRRLSWSMRGQHRTTTKTKGGITMSNPMFSDCCDEYTSWEYGDFEGDYVFTCDGCGNSVEVDESAYWAEYFDGMTDEELEEHGSDSPWQLCELCEYDRSEGLWYSPCPH